MLRWLLGGQSQLWREVPPPVEKTLIDCNTTMEYVSGQFDQIDLVGTMDTTENFAAWWIALGDMAGFNAHCSSGAAGVQCGAPDHSNRHAPPTDPIAQAANLTRAQHDEVLQRNRCGQRVRDEAWSRFNATHGPLSSDVDAKDPFAGGLAMGARATFDARVQALVRRWGGVMPYSNAVEEVPPAERIASGTQREVRRNGRAVNL